MSRFAEKPARRAAARVSRRPPPSATPRQPAPAAGGALGLLAVLALLLTVTACTSIRPAPRVAERGIASWYGPGFHGNLTANGEPYDMHAMTAAHKTLPFGTLVEVRNVENGRRVVVRINDRGPFVRGRVIDLSRAAAAELGMIGPGLARVELVLLPDAAPERIGGVYTVQLGAFRDPERARAFRDRLRRDRLDAEVRREGAWHRVQVGRFADRRQAEELRRDLARLGWTALVVAAR